MILYLHIKWDIHYQNEFKNVHLRHFQKARPKFKAFSPRNFKFDEQFNQDYGIL